LLVQRGAGCSVGAQPFGLLTATSRTHLHSGLEAIHAGGHVGDGVGTGAADGAGAPQVGDFAANCTFRGGSEAAQGTHFVCRGVLVAHAHGTETTFQTNIGLAIGALAVCTSGAGVKLVGRAGQAVVLDTRSGSAHAKRSSVGGADALLCHEVGFHAAAEVFRATEANARASVCAVHDALLLHVGGAVGVAIGFDAVGNVRTTINGGLCQHGATHMKQQGVMDGSNAGSRIGFRGTEDLGGGMKAHFVTEQGISPTNAASFGVRTATSGIQYDGLAGSTNQFDTGTAGAYSQGTNRQTYVGLEGGFGTVRVGYQYTSAYEVGTLSGFTSTSEGAIGGEIAHLWGSGAIGGTRANAITYMTPRMNGFQATVQMGSAGGREQTEWLSANTATGTTLDKQARTSLQIDYTAGPLRTGLAYTKFDASVSGRAAGTTTNNSVTAVASAPVITTFSVLGALSGWNVSPVTGNTTYSANLLQLAGSYDFGAVKVGLTLNSGTKDVTEGPSAVTFGTQVV